VAFYNKEEYSRKADPTKAGLYCTVLDCTAMDVIKFTLFFIGLLLAFVYWWRRRRYFQLGAKLPGPPALPILGNALYFTTTNSTKCFHEFIELTCNYGPVVRLWLGPMLMVLLTDADHVEKVVNHDKVGSRGYVARKIF
jgi:hypothetical protein